MATYYHDIDDPGGVVYYDQADEDAITERDKARVGLLVLKVNRLDPQRAHLVDGIDNPNERIPIVGGAIWVGDIPLVHGRPTGEWLLNYCTCIPHTNMRRDKARKGG